MMIIPPSQYPRASDDDDDDDDSDDVKHDDILVNFNQQCKNALLNQPRSKPNLHKHARIFVIHRTQPRRSPVESTRAIPDDH